MPPRLTHARSAPRARGPLASRLLALVCGAASLGCQPGSFSLPSWSAASTLVPTPGPGASLPSVPVSSFAPPSSVPAPGLGPVTPGPAQGITPRDLPTPSPGPGSGECPASVGLVGDSITAAAGYRTSLEALCPGTRFVNAPRAYAYVGKSTSQMLADFETPLAAGHQVLVVLGGVNNISSPAQVTADLAAMYEKAATRGVKLVAITVMPYQGYASWTPERGRNVRAVGDWIRAQGAAAKVSGVVDAFALFSDPAAPDAARPGWTSDRLHPTATGYAALADAVVAALRGLR